MTEQTVKGQSLGYEITKYGKLRFWGQTTFVPDFLIDRNERREPACFTSGLDPECWTNPGRTIQEKRDRRRAIRICRRCPFQFQCRDWALKERVQGVWGGTDDAWRKAKLLA